MREEVATTKSNKKKLKENKTLSTKAKIGDKLESGENKYLQRLQRKTRKAPMNHSNLKI